MLAALAVSAAVAAVPAGVPVLGAIAVPSLGVGDDPVQMLTPLAGCREATAAPSG